MPRARRRRVASTFGPRHVGWLLAAVLVIAPELAGGRPPSVVAALACALGALAVASRIVDASSVPARATTSAVAGAAVWTALQLVPLPRWLAAQLAPTLVASLDATAATLGDAPPSFIPLTYSVVGTRTELLKILAVLVVLVVALACVRRGGRRLLSVGIATSAALVAFTTLLHTAADAHTVFGLYRPALMGNLPSPLINENHLAAVLSLGIPFQLALVLDARTQVERIGWSLATLACASLCVIAFSRSGLLGLAIGIGVFAALTWRRSRKDPRRAPMSGRAVGIAVLVVLVVIGALIAFEWSHLVEDFDASGLDKVRLAARGLRLLERHPWTGVGRGGYSVAFVGLFGTEARYEIAECWPVQWLAEWGLPMTIVLVSAIGSDLRRALFAPGTRAPAHAAMAALAAIGTHDLFDGATEQLGIALLASATLALAISPGESASVPAATPRAWQSRALVGVVGALTLVAAAAFGPGLSSLTASTTIDRIIAEETNDQADVALTTAVQAMRMHPLEPAFPLLAADASYRTSDARSLRFVNRAMVLAPGWFSPHLVAARVLARRGSVPQAWLELRRAEELREQSSSVEGCALLLATRRTAPAIAAFAESPAVLDRLAECDGVTEETSTEIDAAISDAGLPGPAMRAALRDLAAHRPLDAIARIGPEPRDPRLRRVLGQAYLDAQRAGDARAMLGASPRTSAEDTLLYARTLAATGDVEGMREELGRLRGLAHGDPRQLSSAWVAAGDLEAELHNDGAAMRAYERSAQIEPGGAGLERVAALASRLGDAGRALRAYRELCQHQGPDASACASAHALAP